MDHSARPEGKRTKEAFSMRNDELVYSVKRQLLRSAQVDAEAIAVSVEDGQVRLRGTVGSLSQKREAESIAERVARVEHVHNDLDAKPLSESAREDAGLRGEVLQVLALHCFVPATVDAKARDGVVTLTGEVDWQYECDAAGLVASNALGVSKVINSISLRRNRQDQRQGELMV